jgi:hypothetical protein
MDMNEKLKKLYLATNEKVYKTITEKNKQLDNQVAYPLFLKVPENFTGTKNKIIVYGQETAGWTDINNDTGVYDMGENNIDGILECYHKFFMV